VGRATAAEKAKTQYARLRVRASQGLGDIFAQTLPHFVTGSVQKCPCLPAVTSKPLLRANGAA
jgi:hypothetical protein